MEAESPKEMAIRMAFVAVKKDIAKLQKSQEEQLEKLKGLFADKKQFAEHIEDANSALNKLNEDISKIDELIEEFKELKKDYYVKANLSKQIRNVDRRIDLLKSDFVKQGELTEFEGALSKLSSEIEEIKGDYIQSSDLDEFESRQKKKIKDAEGAVLSQLKGEFVDKEELSEFVKDKLSQIENSIRKIAMALEEIKTNDISIIEGTQKRQAKSLHELKTMFNQFDELKKEVKAIDPAIIPEIRLLNKKIDKLNEDNRLLLKKEAIQATVQRYRQRKIETYKSFASYVFIGLLTFSIAMYFYTYKNPAMFPGINEKMGFVIAGLVLILLYLYAPFEKIYSYFKKKGKEFKEKPAVKEEKIVKQKELIVKPAPSKSKKGKSAFGKVVDFFAGNGK